jgi:hypothetical protein
MLLKIRGVVIQSPCTGTTEINDDWVIQKVYDCDAVDGSPIPHALYRAFFDSPSLCGLYGDGLWIGMAIFWNADIGQRKVLIQADNVLVDNVPWASGSACGVVFSRTEDEVSEPFDCDAFDDLAMNDSPSGSMCTDVAGASCTVTAVAP